MPRKPSDPGWKIEEALARLRAKIDPYIWEQGQELYRRGGAEDFQPAADGTIHVRVVDPRDTRKFLVAVTRDSSGEVTARCQCPYRLDGLCRHQVVSLEFLLAAVRGGEAARGEAQGAPRSGAAANERLAPSPAAIAAAPPPAQQGSVLYRLFGGGSGCATRPDGSLLRVVLLAIGSVRTPHRLGLQLFTGTGWTELRTPDVARWIARGEAGPHPRDAVIASLLAEDGALRREVGSETLGALLWVLAESDALVDRAGSPLAVSRWPWRLAARLARGEGGGVRVQLGCRPGQEAGTEADAGARDVPLEEVTLVAAAAPWVQLEDGTFHPLIAGAPGPVLAEAQEEDFTRIEGADLDRLLERGAAELERLCPGAFDTEPGLIEEVEGVTGARLRLEGTPARLEGKLELSYGGWWVEAPETPEPWTVEQDGAIRRYPPAGQTLARAHRELEGLGFRRSEAGWVMEGQGGLAALLARRERPFVRLELPERLEALNLVERPPLLRLKLEAAGGGARRTPGPRPGSGIGWLDVEARLFDGSREIPVDLDLLKKRLEEDPRGVLQLEDGIVLGLHHGAVRSLVEIRDLALQAAAGSAGDARRGRLRVPLMAIGALIEPGEGREIELGPEVQTFTDGLRLGAPLEAAFLLPEVDSLLRPYQKEAVQWLGRLAGWGLGGILADEMGLGKTVMALAHFFGRASTAAGDGPGDTAPVLVVCPSSLVFNWIHECHRFFPGTRAVGLYGLSPEERAEAIGQGAALLVTSYALLRRDREALEARELRAVVLDEAQHIKNARSQTAQAAFSLRAPERWVLTGTPIENHLGELWSLYHFLLPGFLGTSAEFEERFAGPVARQDASALSKLRARVRPFLLRRTKEQVLKELPPKIDQVERVPLGDIQRRVYESVLLRARAELDGADPERSRLQLLVALTRLRQVCCHPRLVLDDAAVAALGVEAAEITSGKFDLLLELLDECLEEGHRVLLYSQFTSMLDLIEERLEELGARRVRLDGSTRDREGVVRRFQQDPSIPVFLISLKAGGFGLNLTQADTVIIYDPWWNPAAEEQAAARAHRMGQTLPVHVHKLITAGTVEEKILDLQAAKRDLAGKILQADAGALEALSAEELRGLIWE